MSFWNEAAVDLAIRSGDQETLGRYFLMLSRWTIEKEVRTPSWLDRRDLVQVGVLYCFKAIRSKTPDMPRMAYFTQVIKNEARRVASRTCRTAGTSDGIEVVGVCADEATDDLGTSILRTHAARVFPEVAQAFVDQFRAGTSGTVRDFMTSNIGIIYREQAREFFRQLREELAS